MDELIGIQLGGYVIREKIAAGGMGAVYLARHTRLEATCVVKVLLPHVASNPEILARFHREAIATSKLAHPHILQVYEIGQLPNGHPWIMMEHLQGHGLDRLLKRGPLTQHRALAVVAQLCAAAEHAHRHGIVHRDIKPSNVFVCPTAREPFRVKLFDFGIAKMADDGLHTQAGVGCGTPCYMAVEQFQHADEASESSDIYAIASLAIEMISGHLPWGTYDMAPQMYFLKRTTPPDLEGVPAAWRPVLLASLDVDPKKRPRSARVLAQALANATPEGITLVRSLTPELLQDIHPSVAPHDVVTIAPLPAITLALPSSPATTFGLSTGMLAPVPVPPRTSSPRLLQAALLAALVGGGAAFSIFSLTHRAPAAGRLESAGAPLPPPPPPLPPSLLPPSVDAGIADANSPALTTPVPPASPPTPVHVVPRPATHRAVAPNPAPASEFDPSSPTGVR